MATDAADRLYALLKEALTPISLEVEDQSHLHKGHAGWREGGGTHFEVRIVSAAFEGVSRVGRHRLVNQALKDDLAGPVHALAIKAKAPSEA